MIGETEFLAKQHIDEKKALFILKKLREFTHRSKKEKTEWVRKSLLYWGKMADDLLNDVPEEIYTDYKPFKSLMVQRAEGLLSTKL